MRRDLTTRSIILELKVEMGVNLRLLIESGCMAETDVLALLQWTVWTTSEWAA